MRRRGGGEVDGRWRGGGGWVAAYTQQQLSALHFISQIIKDDNCIPFLEIIILWLQLII
jgi:hypothetical protein